MPFPVRSYRAAVWFRALSKSTHVDVDVSLRGDPIIGHNEYIDLVRNRQVLYSITKHAMRRSADEIGATWISFRPKVLAMQHQLLTEFFPPIELLCTTRINRA